MPQQQGYRLALTGAQGTGKSTVTRHLAGLMAGLGVTPQLLVGMGDEVAGPGIAAGPRADARTVHQFAAAHAAREAALGDAAIAVLDRCLLDTLAYADVLGCLPPEEY